MKSKFSLKRHLYRRFFVYLLILFACPVLTTYFINVKNKPKDYERFYVFVVGTADDKAFKNKIAEIIPEDLEIKVESIDQNDEMIMDVFETSGYKADLVIMPFNFFKDFQKFNFIKLNDTSLSSESNYAFYERQYGIMCESYFNEYINYEDDDYYMFFGEKTVHLQGISEGKTNQMTRVLEGCKNA